MEPIHDFETLRRELESLVSRLQTATDPERRKQLLRELRLMLKEADRMSLEQ